MTYGDGLGDVDITALMKFHSNEGKLATVTAVQPPGRFGSMILDDKRVADFKEKPLGDGSWINGGFFVLSPAVLDYIEGDGTYWEKDPMEKLAREGQMAAWLHKGFWSAMDTLRDKNALEEKWRSGAAPWKVW